MHPLSVLLMLMAIVLISPGDWRLIAPWPPAVRIGLAFVLAGLDTLLAPAGEPRRRFGGFCFSIVLLCSVLVHGDRIGLRAPWLRLLVGAVLFLALFLPTNPPAYLQRWMDRWKARRKRE
jgi:hypothetical protein